ncbi:hypothetical protein [Streptomyces coerulescens]|uniref:Uncharacterized protein n=1 Tax=Streptomyces coerulescens TaxID=29304 RepID=A0ABW0CZZ0_STRCD
MNDDELLARLKAADPALTASAPPPDIDHLVEATVHTDTTSHPATTTPDRTTYGAQTTPGRGRRRRFALAAAAGLLLLGGGLTAGIMANDDNGSATAAGPLQLTLAKGAAVAKCAEPVPENLREYPTLFAGTVTSVKGSAVTFRVTHWLRGGGQDEVRLDSNADGPEQLWFSNGENYLVAADTAGVVPPCGANAASAETIGKFRQAYGR